MVRAVLKGVPLPVGFVDNKRSLVAVGNLVDLLIRCLDDPKAAGGTFLVRDGLDLSTRELIARIATAGGRHPRVFPVPSAFMRLAASLVGRTGLVRPLLGSLQVDDSETRQRLDWLPPVGVDKAIAETVCDFLEARH
jgi:UDP-glucose 4-epimerase